MTGNTIGGSFGALVIAASKLINRQVFGKEQRRLGAGRPKGKRAASC